MKKLKIYVITISSCEDIFSKIVYQKGFKYNETLTKCTEFK